MRTMRQVPQRLCFQKEVILIEALYHAICTVVLSATRGIAVACGALSIRSTVG